MESENQDHETCGGIGTFVGLGLLLGLNAHRYQ